MKIPKEARKVSRELFKASFKDGALDLDRIRFVSRRLGETKPRHYLSILQNFTRLIRLELASRHAYIESATDLEPSVREQLERELRAKHGQDLTVEFKTVPALLGGLRIKIGNNVFDSSVRERLHRLEIAA